MPSLAGKDSAKMAWDAIETTHMRHECVREAKLQTFKWDFEGLKMQDDEAVETLDEIDVVRRFLHAALARYMQLVTSIEQCVNLNTLTMKIS